MIYLLVPLKKLGREKIESSHLSEVDEFKALGSKSKALPFTGYNEVTTQTARSTEMSKEKRIPKLPHFPPYIDSIFYDSTTDSNKSSNKCANSKKNW